MDKTFSGTLQPEPKLERVVRTAQATQDERMHNDDRYAMETGAYGEHLLGERGVVALVLGEHTLARR